MPGCVFDAESVLTGPQSSLIKLLCFSLVSKGLSLWDKMGYCSHHLQHVEEDDGSISSTGKYPIDRRRRRRLTLDDYREWSPNYLSGRFPGLFDDCERGFLKSADHITTYVCHKNSQQAPVRARGTKIIPVDREYTRKSTQYAKTTTQEQTNFSFAPIPCRKTMVNRKCPKEVVEANRPRKKAQDASKITPPMKKPPPPDLVHQLLRHFQVIATTDSVDEGWNSYVFLVDLIAGTPVVHRHVRHIPFSHLHRLARLLSRNRPQTRRQFLRLLAVLTYLNYWGGKLKQHEWNALVAHAGSGWRKTKLEDFGNAMKVFNDMRAGRLPGSSDLLPPDREFLEGPAVEPDIYTYTSLLTIASRAMDSKNLHNISSMLTGAGLPPNRITHLSLMRYFTLKADLGGIRATLLKMRQQDLELGLDGVNACLWAYGRNARLDIVMMIYRVLRHNVLPETCAGREDIKDTIGRLGEEYIFVEPELQPNEITLTTVIQVMAYHGHFPSTLNIFMDMLSFDNTEKGAPLEKNSAGVYEPTSYKPSLAVFRAIFLGFSRHARHVQQDSDWNMDNLSQIFDLFLELPPDSNLTHNTIYLIMLAFDKASGRDIKMLRDVWMRMVRRFGITFHKAHSVSRLARLKRLLFPEDEVISQG
ncbi:hypothetical protein BYT27DRAFT_6718182 [Phlegmacium glaucopus]|nr:hypothetical protein BYT27DRAFT_6718182 [Phlegmacium glaucopus]